MIKAVKDNIVILGLTDENLKRLTNNQPIKFNTKELGIGDFEVFILHGENEDKITDLLVPLIGPKTKIII